MHIPECEMTIAYYHVNFKGLCCNSEGFQGEILTSGHGWCRSSRKRLGRVLHHLNNDVEHIVQSEH